MTQFEFLVCQLQCGVQSKPTPQSTSIACSIVENYFLEGQKIVGVTTHLANEVEQ